METLRKLLDERGITAYRMAVDLNIPHSTVSEWLSGAYKPKTDKLLLLSKYFDVPLETFIEGAESNE